MKNVDIVAEGFRFGECPRWHDGNLYFSDVHGAKIHRIDCQDRLTTVVEFDHPSGLGWTPDGDLLAISSHACTLLRYRDGDLKKTIDLNDRGLVLANDMVTDARGGSYIDGLAPGFERGQLPLAPILYVDPQGDVRTAAVGFHGANGMVITPDGKTLIVAETFAFRLTAFDITEDGSLHNRRVWAQFNDSTPATSIEDALTRQEVLPDGIALDAEGAVWVADCKRGGGVLRYAEGGRLLDRISFGNDTVIAPALGGPGRSRLYMVVGPSIERVAGIIRGTERPYSIRRAEVDVPGAGLP